MGILKFCIIVSFLTGLFSCSQKVISVYYYDVSKVDGGEITAAYLRGFFVEKNVHTSIVRSDILNEELKKIKDSINKMPLVEDFDDSYYGYAFVTEAKDTLFADYNLTYWRYKERRAFYKGKNLKPTIEKFVH